MKKQKIALFHPWIKSKGGAERVVLELINSKNYNIDIYTWIYEPERTFEEFKGFKIKVIAPKVVRKLSRMTLLRGLFFPISLFSKIPLEKYDYFLVSTSGIGEFILFRNYKPNKTLAYVHTPLRDANEEIINWNLKNKYKGFIKKIVYLCVVNIYKILEKIAWKRIDLAIFNSELSLERSKKHKLVENKRVIVVYPPINIQKISKIKSSESKYFLYPSRINNSKRQDLLIKSWKTFVEKHPNEELIIAGSTENKSYLEKIKNLASKTRNIEIKINLNEKKLGDLYRNSKAIIFIPFMEDFGIVPFEAMAYGKPLIAMDRGGYVNLIENIPQYYKVKESSSEEELINGINKTMEDFLKSSIKAKRIKNLGNDNVQFINKIEEILKEIK